MLLWKRKFKGLANLVSLEKSCNSFPNFLYIIIAIPFKILRLLCIVKYVKKKLVY